jgi:hypothetical protein
MTASTTQSAEKNKGWTADKRLKHSDTMSAMWTADLRDKQSAIMRERWADAAWKKKALERKGKPPSCPDCGESDIQKFYLDKTGRRTNARCQQCHKARNTLRWQSKDIMEKRSAKAVKYGLTPEEFFALYKKHDGKCAICGNEPTTLRGLHIDHCHNTGKVRGLLCHGCNVGIGSMRDDVVLMRKAIAYIEGM